MIYFTNARKIDIFLGEFNIDAFDSDACAKLYDVLSNYTLDYVYLRKLFPTKHVNAVVKNMYVSDHDAVKLKILIKRNYDSKTQFEVTKSKLQITFLG